MSLNPSSNTPGQPIPYATPMQYNSVGCWRERDLLVVTRNGPIPPQCVKCNNSPDESFTWRKTLYWHNPGLYVLIFFPGILIYAVVALIVRKTTRVEARLCAEHRAVRVRNIAIAWLIAAAGVASVFLSIALGDSRQYRNSPLPVLLLIGGLVLAFGSAIFGLLKSRVLTPKKIDDNYAWLKGACSEYLDALPPTGQ